jgi:hypothetical protein
VVPDLPPASVVACVLNDEHTMKMTGQTIEASTAAKSHFPLEHSRLLTREEEASLARLYKETHDPPWPAS